MVDALYLNATQVTLDKLQRLQRIVLNIDLALLDVLEKRPDLIDSTFAHHLRQMIENQDIEKVEEEYDAWREEKLSQ